MRIRTLDRFLRRPARPFVIELELTIGLAFVLLALVLFFLEYRLILLSKAARERALSSDLRVAGMLSRKVVEALRDGRLPSPSEDSGADPILAGFAREAGLRSLELRLLDGSSARLGSTPASIDRLDLPDSSRLESAGWAYSNASGYEETVFWFSLAREGLPAWVLRIETEGSSLPTLERQVRPIAIAVPVVLFAVGGVLLLQLVRINRRIGALVRGAVESGLAGDPSAARDETVLVEGTLRRTVAELRRREGELESLLARERDRAGELQTVAAALRRHMPGGLVAVDGDGTIRDMNGRAQQLFGIDSGGAGRSHRELFREFPDLVELVGKALAGRETVVREEIDLPGPADEGGPRRILSVSAVPVMGGEGRFLGVLVFAIDVTEVRDLERRLRVRETMAQLGEISAGLAHELRNSIAAASGFCRLAGEDLRGGSPVAADRNLGRIREELDGLARTVSQFLDFARSEPAELGPVDLEPVIDELAGEFERRFPDVELSIDAPPVRVLGERVRLQQILWNLLRNAAQELGAAGCERARVELSVRRLSAGRAELRVEDRGRGVPASIRGSMFLPFVSGREGGTGLGLSLVQRYLLAVGGEIRYEDRTGGGARFVVEIPMA
jgi:PAS domain S-box-containing protein